MGSAFFGLSTALRGLQADQLAIDTIDQNVSNANTPGYSAQNPVLETTLPYTTVSMNNPQQPQQIGTGVQVTTIQRSRDAFYDLEYRQQNSGLGNWDSLSKMYQQIEQIFPEPSNTGLQSQMDKFWNDWRAVANDPTNLGSRASLQQDSASLAISFNNASTQLFNLSANTDQQVVQTTTQINSIATQIASLNAQIASVSALNGGQANDLMDKRDILLDQLSNIVQIQTSMDPNGSVSVSIGGHTLVEESQAYSLTNTVNGQGTHDVVWASDGSKVNIQGGSLAGTIQIRDTVIPSTKSQLDQLANAIITSVNTQHKAGYTANGTTNVTFFDGTDAASMVLDPAIAADPNNIAAATAASSPGDGTNAQAIANLQQTAIIGSANPDQFYQSFIAQLGADSQQAQTMDGNQQALVNNVNTQRKSVSGVNLDEEMTKLVQFQNAYQASAKVINTIDTILQTLLSTAPQN